MRATTAAGLERRIAPPVTAPTRPPARTPSRPLTAPGRGAERHLPAARAADPARSRAGAEAPRGARPTPPGWWRPPRRAGRGTDEGARHRAAVDGPTLPLRRTGGHRRPPTPEEQRRRRLRLARRIGLGAVAAAVLGPLLAFVVGYLVFPVPTPDQAVNNQVALVDYADGSTLARLVPEQGNRIKVPIEAVPVPVREAVLSAEDRTFYSNPGFDLQGILRAAWNQLRGGVGGGSTITQQYVKNTLVGDEATLWRKYKELIVSFKISQQHTKDQILADYLNAIYFGRGAYGIQAAAHAYFGEDVQKLTVAQGAVLAAVIQSPSRWDPAVNPEHAVERWNYVLDGMVQQGWLSPAERKAQTYPATSPRKPTPGGFPSDSGGHIVSAVTAELADLGITEQDVAHEGLRITTTIDPRRQQQAVDAAHQVLGGQPVNLRTALVAIDPQTGGVLAYYGGDNGLGLDYTRVNRQPGSTFKPFVVLAALQHDPPIGLGTTFSGEPVPGLRNDDGADCEHCDLKQAMTLSNNVVFDSLAKQVGPQNVADAAHAAGITAPLADPDDRLALGNKEITVFDLASAYATIAAGGVYHAPHLVSSVVTADGRVLYRAPDQGDRRFSERVARNVTEAMLDVAPHDGLALPGGQEVAAKTGTVQSRFQGQNNDAWMGGFTPSIAAAVWMGTDMNSPIRTASGTPIEGKSLPGDIWHDVMAGAEKADPAPDFAPFHAIGDPPSNLPPGQDPRRLRAPAPPPPAPPAPPAPSAAPLPPGTPPSAVLGPDGQPVRAIPSASAAPTAAPAPSNCTLLAPCG